MLRTIALVLVAVVSSEIAVGKPACDELAGSVIFYDTLYGLGTGLVLSGLYLAAAQDGEDAGQKVAGGSLVGAVIGAGAGALESGMRDCDGKAATLRPGLSVGVAMIGPKPAAALTWSW